MKILVTGGAGFIGSNFIRYIMKKYPDYKIVNLDKLTYAGNLDNLKDLEKNKHYEFVRGDIADQKIVGKWAKEVQAIVNFAAETHVDRSIVNAGDFVKTNVFGTYTLLEAAKKNSITKYIQISTDEVYGSIEKGAFKEADNLKPSSPYSATKASADLMALSYYTTYQLPVIITRSSNNFGPYQFPEKVIPLFITNALEDQPVPLYGDGRNVRDWVYVLDNCEAIDQVMHKGKAGEIYNIGGNNELTNIELTKKILELLGKKDELIRSVTDRLGHDRRYSLDCFKLRSELGWKPQYDFNQALQDTITWYKENKSWWKRLKK
ncbi:MAG: dTDP-glucose 4,6-dehydratase [bacterium]|nr:dTDP-glucose 4,6-dehydratase [bacterium]